MADLQDKHSGQNGPGKVLFHNENDGTYSESVASHLRGWDTTDLTWNRLPVDHATGALLVKATLSAGTVDIGIVDQGTGGSSAWLVSNGGTFAVQAAATLAAETTKVIGTVNVAASQTIAVTNTGTFAVQADTELPAAAALADGAANPTAPFVAAANVGFNGTTWDRLKTVIAGTPLNAIGGTGLLAVAPQIVTGSTFQPFSSPAQIGDGGNGQNILGVQNQTFSGDQYARAKDGRGLADGNIGLGLPASTNYNFNATTWDKQRGNFNTTTGDAGSKTASFVGATQTNYNARGAWMYIILGTVTGTSPTLSLQLQWSPDAGTTWVNFGPALTNLISTGQSGTIFVYPTNTSQAAGVTPANLTNGATQTLALNAALPRTWRINYTIGGTATPTFPITAVYVNYIL